MTSTGLDSFWYAYWKVGVRSRISLLLLSLMMTMLRRRLNTIEYIFSVVEYIFWHLKKKKELRLWNINQISLFEATWHLTTKLLDSGSWFIFLSSQCLDRKCSREIVSFSLIQFVSLWARSSLVTVFVHAQVECTSAYYDHYWTLLPCFIDLPFHIGRKFTKYVFMFHSKWVHSDILWIQRIQPWSGKAFFFSSL